MGGRSLLGNNLGWRADGAGEVIKLATNSVRTGLYISG
jgi:hypothetical protein